MSESPRLRIVFLGLSITSSWGNGHATTYRALVKGLVRQGHDVRFLERDVPWYAPHRDLPDTPLGQVSLYLDRADLERRHTEDVRDADLVVVGSYVPEGVEVGDWVMRTARGVRAFYDIDTPVTLSMLERGGADYVSREQVAAYDLYLSFTGGPTLERLEREFGAERARPLYCSVDADVHAAPAAPARWDLGYLGTYAEDRQLALERLLVAPARLWPRGRFTVAGAQFPDGHVAWPANVERRHHVPPDEHGAWYGSQRFTLNVTRAAMVRAGYSPSVRLFEAAACGTPIVSDAWAGLSDVFTPGREILVARGPEDVLEVLQDLPESDRRAIARAARRRVLDEHTGEKRAEQLVSYFLEPAARR